MNENEEKNENFIIISLISRWSSSQIKRELFISQDKT